MSRADRFSRWPGLTRLLRLAVRVIITRVGGTPTPAGVDIVGRSVPVTTCDRFFAPSRVDSSV